MDFLARNDRPLSTLFLLAAFAVHAGDGLAKNRHDDLFIYRAGAAVGLGGHSPYRPGSVHDPVAVQFADRPDLADNCGFFLPPQAILLLSPLTALPWPVAKVAWAVGTFVLAALAIRRLPGLSANPSPGWVPPILAAVILFDPAVIVGLLPGQTSLPAVSCIVLGEVAYRSGRRQLAAFLWAAPFVKPHVAMPLLPLAWFLGGRRRAAELVLWLAGLNLLGCLIATGSPMLLLDYADYLRAGHKAVTFNRAELNPQITSWNRLAFAAGGPLVELTALTTLAGYAVWAGLIGGRVALAGRRPTLAWAMAVAGVGAVVCPQVMGYEMAMLALVVPHVLDSAAAGRRIDAAVMAVLLLFATGPFEPMLALGQTIAAGRVPNWLYVPDGPAGFTDRVAAVLVSFRSLGAALLAVVLLVRGWPETSAAVADPPPESQ